MAVNYCGQSSLHAVTQSCPSPEISYTHTVQGPPQVSRITDVNSIHGIAKSSSEDSKPSTALKDIHMPARLMENFLELARENTSKDLETCGVLGASLLYMIFDKIVWLRVAHKIGASMEKDRAPLLLINFVWSPLEKEG